MVNQSESAKGTVSLFLQKHVTQEQYEGSDFSASPVCVCVCVCVCVFSHVRLHVIPWTVACQAPLSVFLARILEWVAIFSSRGSSQLRD